MSEWQRNLMLIPLMSVLGSLLASALSCPLLFIPSFVSGARPYPFLFSVWELKFYYLHISGISLFTSSFLGGALSSFLPSTLSQE